MATSDPRLAALALDALAASGIGFAVLHREHDVAAGDITSDVDVAVDRDLVETTSVLADALAPHGIAPIVIWPYDVGALTVFFVTHDATSGVQLDMLFDPDGTGKYGFRSPDALVDRQPGVRWPQLTDVDRLLYLATKRGLKHDDAGLGALREEVRDIGSDTVATRATALLSERVRDRVFRDLGLTRTAKPGATASLHRTLANGQRYARRLRSPVGFWVAADTGGHAEPLAVLRELSARLGTTLPIARCAQVPSTRAASTWWWASLVAPTRLKPAVIVTPLAPACPFRPDVIVGADVTSLDDLAHRVVADRAALVRRRLHDRAVPVV